MIRINYVVHTNLCRVSIQEHFSLSLSLSLSLVGHTRAFTQMRDSSLVYISSPLRTIANGVSIRTY